MEKLNKITKFLNKELNVKKIKDSSKNGLQVKAKKDVKKIGFAVDACISTFEKAKKAKCDLLIVHHGLLWKKQKDILGLKKKRVDYLRKKEISLYASHLPLDLHKEYGNNIQLANMLNLKKINKFGKYHGKYIGYKGVTKTTMSKIGDILNKKLKTKSTILNFGKKQIKTIGIVSGGGSDAIIDAIKEIITKLRFIGFTKNDAIQLRHILTYLHQNSHRNNLLQQQQIFV